MDTTLSTLELLWIVCSLDMTCVNIFYASFMSQHIKDPEYIKEFPNWAQSIHILQFSLIYNSEDFFPSIRFMLKHDALNVSLEKLAKLE